MEMIRAARLVRVSSQKQAKDDRTSLPNQIRVLTEICEKNGWVSTDEDLFVEVISGAKGIDKREILADLLEQISDGRYKRLCVLDFDRSTRKGLGEWEQIASVLVDAGCRIVINGQEYDLTDDNAELLTDIHAVFAKRERTQIRKRTIRGMEAIAKEGKWTGGHIPFGYRAYYPESRDGEKPQRSIEIDPLKADAVRMAYELYATGLRGYALIADELNLRGFSWHDGEKFNHQHVWRILLNPTYTGTSVRRREYTKHFQKVKLPPVVAPSQHFEPIVEMDLWERCQAIRDGKPTRSLSMVGRWALSGILHCTCCGEPMMISHNDGHVYYRCQTRRKRGHCESPQRIWVEIAHLAVIRGLGLILKGKAELREDEAPEDNTRLFELKAQLAHLDQEEMQLFERLKLPLEDGGIREDQFKRFNQALLVHRDTIEKEMKTHQRQKKAPMVAIADLGEVVGSLTHDDPMFSDIVRATFREIRMIYTGHKIHRPDLSTRKIDQYRMKSAVLLDGTDFSW